VEIIAEISYYLASYIDIFLVIFSGIVLFKYHDNQNGLLFYICLASFLIAGYGLYYDYADSFEFVIELRVFYDLIEHVVLIWYCASLINFKNWKKITGILCTVVAVGWIHMALFMSRDEIMDILGTYEMIEMISIVPFAGLAMMRQAELNYKKDNLGEQILLFASFFYAFSTIVILGLYNTAIGKDHYYIHDISALIKDSLFVFGFWVIIKRERRKKTELTTKAVA
jgi:hypothetical protein